MESSDYIRNAKRDAKLVEALNVALHTLVVHDGMLVRAGGREWALNFRSQIARVKEAMEILGVNISEPLMAPPLGPADGDQMKGEDDDDEA